MAEYIINLDKALYDPDTGAALKEGKTVEIVYHRKYNTKISLLDKVDCINEYMWHGVPEYAVSTWCDQIAEYSHIIDEVRVQEGE